MPTLSADLTATQTYIPTAQGLDPGFYSIEDEVIRVTADKASSRSDRGNGQLDVLGPVIARGVAGTTAAAHAAGTTITAYNPAAPEADAGGGQTADVQAALDGAASPSAENVFATMADAGVQVLADPGNVWAGETLFAAGYRINVSEVVYESGGLTSGVSEPSWPNAFSAAVYDDVNDGDGAWTPLGYVGAIPFAAVGSNAYTGSLEAIGEALAGQTVPQTNPTVQNVIDALVAAFGLVQSD